MQALLLTGYGCASYFLQDVCRRCREMAETQGPEASQTNLLQGTLDLLILKALALGEMHGFGISRRIEQITQGTFQVKPGSLFPALYRMEEAGGAPPALGRARKQRPGTYSPADPP